MEITHNLHLNQLNEKTPHGRFGFVKAETGPVASHTWVQSHNDTPPTWEAIGEYASNREMPVLVTGGMTNLYVTEEGFDGLLVTYRDNGVKSPMHFDQETGRVECSASTLLADFVRKMCIDYKRPIGNLAGIPGTLGGAVLGNAGRTVTRNNIGDVVAQVVTYDLQEGREKVFDAREAIDGRPFFGQRSCYLKDVNAQSTRYVIRRVHADLGREGDAGAVSLYEKRWNEREGSPDGKPGKNKEGEGTAGSVFVNGVVPKEAAMRFDSGSNRPVLVRHLLKEVKMPGTNVPLIEYEVNGAGLTSEHAFLRTRRHTRDRDVAELLHVAVSSVFAEYGFVPRLEIGILARDGLITLPEFIAKHSGGGSYMNYCTAPGIHTDVGKLL